MHPRSLSLSALSAALAVGASASHAATYLASRTVTANGGLTLRAHFLSCARRCVQWEDRPTATASMPTPISQWHASAHSVRHFSAMASR